jgi:hypothetical protein
MTSCSLDLGNKDAVMVATGAWLVELSELAALRKSQLEQAKAFLTETKDNIRLPYAKSVEKFPRCCVFVGTTNDEAPFQDHTGARRFLPITVESIDFETLKAERDQLWAEATHIYKSGARPHAARDDIEMLMAEQQAMTAEDPDMGVAETIRTWYLKKASPRPSLISAAELFSQVLFIAPMDQARYLRQIGRVMRLLGCVRSRHMIDGVRGYCYQVPTELRMASLGYDTVRE